MEAIAGSPWWLDWLRPAYFPRDEGSLEERLADSLDTKRMARNFTDIPADFDLASVSIEAGRLSRARRLLEPLTELDAVVYRGGRQPSQPWHLLGRAEALRGLRKEARRAMETALAQSPGDLFVLTELAALTDEPQYLERLEEFWSRLDAQYFLGRALLRYGRAQEALDALTFVVDRLPEFREPRVYRAAALAELGHVDQAAEEYLEASKIRLEPIVEGDRISELFRTWAADHPEDPEVRFDAAQVLHQLGHFAGALELLDGLEELDPPPALRPGVTQERQRILEAMER